MPIYEYKCKKCGKIHEFIQKFSDPPMTDCDECGTAGSLEKLMSLSSFQLKGSGWYLTDYARKDKQKESKEDSSGDKNKKSQEPKDSGKKKKD
jgi:putative FmdB family regulatory protein